MNEWKRTNNQEDIVCRTGRNDVPYLSFPLLESCGLVKHGFSTRMGGVSTGIYESMNLSFSRGDEEAAVMENFARFGRLSASVLPIWFFPVQTHTDHIRIVTEADRGKGYHLFCRLSRYRRIDYGCAGTLPCYLLRRLRTALSCRSGAKSHRAFPFGMAWNGCRYRRKDGAEDGGSIQKPPGEYPGLYRTVHLPVLLRGRKRGH